MVILYKLKKVLKERKKDIIQSSLIFSLMLSVFSLFGLIFLSDEKFSKSDKIQIGITSVILTFINLTIIYLIDYLFGHNIIVSIFLGYSLSFLLFFIPCLIFILCFEITELELDKSDIRSVKLNNIFGNLF